MFSTGGRTSGPDGGTSIIHLGAFITGVPSTGGPAQSRQTNRKVVFGVKLTNMVMEEPFPSQSVAAAVCGSEVWV